MNWTEKYRPKIFSEIVGQEEAVAKVKKFVEDFHSGKSAKRRKKALFLHGSPGTGKTTIAFAAANETNSEIFELNASDLRNKINLQEVLRPAVEQQSLLKKKKIILIDEVDGISGFYDKGGILEILSLIEVTSYPVIITANDPWVKKLSTLRKKTEMIKLKEINYKVIKDVLIEILRKENKFLNNNILTEISIKSRGDLRAAINDLQREASLKSLETSPVLDERNKEKYPEYWHIKEYTEKELRKIVTENGFGIEKYYKVFYGFRKGLKYFFNLPFFHNHIVIMRKI